MKIFWMTEEQLRRVGRPKWGAWFMIASPIFGVAVGQLLWWLANRH